MNVQLLSDPDGRLLWISPALPGCAHDLSAGPHPQHYPNLRTSGGPILAITPAWGPSVGDDDTQTLAGRDLTPTQQTVNRPLSAAREPVERGVARLK
ncbi:transposase family protein [Streptomyces collinus]|uniref:transposase family protein n=1 Tax=Streptomyces collinus TaxID=42684 RepID=UPI00367574F3